jgi:CRISPR-associated exonuclease Cas4
MLIEFDSSGVPYPVEYKHGPRRAKIHDDVQLAAQAMCLEEMMGNTVERGAIYHVSSRVRIETNFHRCRRPGANPHPR